MPFTGSHPAAVLPFVPLGLVPSALVIGSMTPDLPYFFPLPVDADTTHTLLGVVGVDVLLGLGCFLLWHTLFGPAAVVLAPTGARRRLPAGVPFSLRHQLRSLRALALVVVSLAVGAATHVLWDAFTHAGRWGERHVAWLAEQHEGVAGYTWSQYASGLLGGLVLAVWLALWWRRTPVGADRTGLPEAGPGLKAAAATAVVGATFVVAAVAAGRELTEPGGPDVVGAAYAAATRGGLAAGLAALAVALVVRLRQVAQLDEV